jgi:uncharacterized protein YcsI (UPF0317 family)
MGEKQNFHSSTDPVVSPGHARAQMRRGEWTGVTVGAAPGYVQCNLVVLPQELASDFMLFCQRNPKPCPVLDVTDVGSPVPRRVAAQADLRTDLPRYRVYRHGELTEEVTDITHLWTGEMVGFLLGCSFSFDPALQAAGLPSRHAEEGKNIPMFRTNLACVAAGRFHGPMVVSMRPMLPAQAVRAVEITSRFPNTHGAPVHLGDPAAIGIADLARPDWGDPVTVHPGEMPVFWACGVTPQAVALESRPELMITHAPGHMFITDVRDADLAEGPWPSGGGRP